MCAEYFSSWANNFFSSILHLTALVYNTSGLIQHTAEVLYGIHVLMYISTQAIYHMYIPHYAKYLSQFYIERACCRFAANEGVIVLGATNKKSNLDKYVIFLNSLQW